MPKCCLFLEPPAEQLKWTSKREKSMVKAVRKGMRGAPEPGAPAPATGRSPRILFTTAFKVDFSCSAGVLRRDSISAHIWYGLRENISAHYSNLGSHKRNCARTDRRADGQTDGRLDGQTNEQAHDKYYLGYRIIFTRHHQTRPMQGLRTPYIRG